MTAVEWFIAQLPIRIVNSYHDEIDKVLQMEKRQIQNAFIDGEMNIHNSKRDECFAYETAEQYYNETYKMAEQ